MKPWREIAGTYRTTHVGATFSGCRRCYISSEVPGGRQSAGNGAMGCSSMAERRTVNAVVVGSTPTAPVQEIQQAEIAPGAPSLPVVCSILLSYSNRYRFAKTVVLPARSNAITSYGSLLSPISIPGEPVTIPGTAKPVICGF